MEPLILVLVFQISKSSKIWLNNIQTHNLSSIKNKLMNYISEQLSWPQDYVIKFHNLTLGLERLFLGNMII